LQLAQQTEPVEPPEIAKRRRGKGVAKENG
jgi:hypothetical protein